MVNLFSRIVLYNTQYTILSRQQLVVRITKKTLAEYVKNILLLTKLQTFAAKSLSIASKKVSKSFWDRKLKVQK